MCLDDIAIRAGVAKSTASKALNHYPGVSEATRRRVWRAAQALGVMPRRYRTTPQDAQQTVLLLPMAESLFREMQQEPSRITASVYHAFQESLIARQCDLLLGPAGLDAERATQYIHEHIGKRFNAVTLLPPVNPALAAYLHRRRIPTVCLSGSVDQPGITTITADHAQGTRLLMQHLIELGHRKIGYLGSGLHSRSHLDRFQAYLLEFELAKLPYHRKWMMQPTVSDEMQVADRSVERWHEPIARFIEKLCASKEMPTALVCVNDDFACKVIELLAIHGLSVPDDLSITGWGHETQRSLTTIEVDPRRIGEAAAQSITAQMRDNECTTGRLLTPVKLIKGNSTAAPRI